MYIYNLHDLSVIYTPRFPMKTREVQNIVKHYQIYIICDIIVVCLLLYTLWHHTGYQTNQYTFLSIVHLSITI